MNICADFVALRFRILVKKGAESKCQSIIQELMKTQKWVDVIEDVFHPVSVTVKFKGNTLVPIFKAVIPGLLYVKMKMSPDFADIIESIDGVYGFVKSGEAQLVLPLDGASEVHTNALRQQTLGAFPEEAKLLKKDDYVSIVSGAYKGAYGILTGTTGGKMDVSLFPTL